MSLPQPDSLYTVELGSDNLPPQSYPDYVDLRDRNRSFESLAAYNIVQAGLNTGENPSRNWGFEVSGNYFDALGIQPYLGRFFHGSDEHGANSAPFVVLSYPFWQTRFQDDHDVAGRTILLNKHPFTVIGVAPPGFHGTLVFSNPDFLVPMVNEEQLEGTNFLDARGNRWVFMVLGHLKAGVTRPQAIADLNFVGSYLEKTYPREHGKMTFVLARPSLYGDFLG